MNFFYSFPRNVNGTKIALSSLKEILKLTLLQCLKG